MPVMNGATALMQIRELNKTVPIYVVTAFHREFLSELDEVKEKNYKFQLLRKPLNSEDIITVCNSTLIGPTSL